MTELLTTTLAEIICTRLSHDLIGNIGAVSNAVELLDEEDAEFMSDITSILKVSSKVLTSRLKFFRLAFGLDNSTHADSNIILQTSQDYIQTIGNQKNYPITLQIKLQNPRFSRMALLGVMIMSDIMIKGGEIEIEDDGEYLAIACSSPSPLSVDKIQQIKALCNQHLPENIAQFAPVLYLLELTKHVGYEIKISEHDGFALLIG